MLRRRHAELLFAEREFAQGWSTAGMVWRGALQQSYLAYPWSFRKFLFEMAWNEYLWILRKAQSRHPARHWGFPEG